jgi:hypothetical protein
MICINLFNCSLHKYISFFSKKKKITKFLSFLFSLPAGKPSHLSHNVSCGGKIKAWNRKFFFVSPLKFSIYQIPFFFFNFFIFFSLKFKANISQIILIVIITSKIDITLLNIGIGMWAFGGQFHHHHPNNCSLSSVFSFCLSLFCRL